MADPCSQAWRDDAFCNSVMDFLKEGRGWRLEPKACRRWRSGWKNDHCIAWRQAIAERGSGDEAIAEAYALSDQDPQGAEYERQRLACAHRLAPRLALNLIGKATS